MSSRSSFVSVPSGQAEDAVTDNYTMSIVGARYEASPNVVADGQIRGFQIDSQGRMVINGPTADNAAFVARPIPVGGIYEAALPTYASGDATTQHMDVNGRTIVTDDQALTALNSILAAVDGLEGFTDGLETLIGTTNTTLTTLNGYVDGLEGFVDGIEALIGTTNTTLTTLNGYVDGIETLITATNDAVDGLEALATTLNGAVKNEDAAASSGDAGMSILAVRQDTLASSNADGDYGHVKQDSLGRLYVNTKDSLLSVVDFIDNTPGPVVDASVDNVPASASTPLTVVASLAGAAKKIRVADTTGEFIGLYSDPAGTPVLEAIINPGMDGEMEIRLAAGTALGLRNMANVAIAVGQISIQFLG